MNDLYNADEHPWEEGCPSCHSTRVIGLVYPGNRTCIECGYRYAVDHEGQPILQRVEIRVAKHEYLTAATETPRTFGELLVALADHGWALLRDDEKGPNETLAYRITAEDPQHRIVRGRLALLIPEGV